MAYIGSPAAPTIATVSDGTVTSNKLADNSVTSAKIGVDVIVAEDLAANSVTVSELTDGAVTPAKLSTGHPNWDSSGNVGIGTTTPAQILEVKQLDQSAFKGIRINNPNGYIGSAGIEFQVDATYCKAAIFQKRNYGNGGGDLIFAVDSSSDASNWVEADEKMRIDINGNLLVGTTNTNNNTEDGLRLYGGAKYASFTRNGGAPCALVRRSSGGEIQEFFYNSTKVGTVSISTTNTSYNTSSDYRLKENVIEVTDGIDRVKLLKPSRFNFISDPDKTVDGFLAHEVQDVVPEAIFGTKDAVDADGNPEYQGIDQSKLVPLLTAALQEAITKIESLEARVATLESA